MTIKAEAIYENGVLRLIGAVAVSGASESGVGH